MSQAILNMVAKRALKDVAQKNINSKDPYFEEVHVYDRHGRDTGKVKKHKKGVPPGVSARDGEILKSVRRKAYRLDMSLFNCCGIRFGWSSVIGIIPGIGDLIDCLMAWMVVRHCSKIEGGLPPAIKSRMLFNIVLDFALGLVPFLGDLADAVFRANTRNAWILEEYLIKKAEEERKLAEKSAKNNSQATPAPPRPTTAPSSKSFSGLFGSRSRQHDEEMGVTSVSNNGRSQSQRPQTGNK
ncbi:Ph domain-containing protein [Pleurostoma richardsiae]|uniref:Ph domain-containing protein n=1 Tax=Pleurostoma richardsiae TaxID=41990 RepID=A0AA38VUX5_9PEZI|nr:Ph domain-containing protein [Pleurostoma richardsiae]